jgi:predicted CXXCH cytochrome family protein
MDRPGIPRETGLPPAPQVRRRAPVALIASGLLLAVGIVLLAGCRTPEQRYRVLSFFFDGVPPPPGMVLTPEQINPWDPALREMSDREAVTPTTGPAEEVTIRSIHAPYERRECAKCHGSAGSFRMSVTDIAPCASCHKGYDKPEAGDWVHGPLAVSQCNLCHVAHRSENFSLLKQPQPDLCFYCHDAQPLLERPYHVLAKDKQADCGDCHDPHMAGNRLLLVDGDTFRHRRFLAFKPQSTHQPYKEKKCDQCHILTESNRVRDDIEQACRSCHQELIDKQPASAHEAVRQGKCVSCHHPHESPRPHLVRVTAEQMCYTCHKPADLQTPGHPPVTRADCLMCHNGHESEREHLLRPSPIPPNVEAPAPAAPTVTEPDRAGTSISAGGPS